MFCTEEDTDGWRKEAVPENTRRHTSWGVNVYITWARSQNETLKDFEPEDPRHYNRTR